MKKNTMMRVASVLLIAVLLSTCAISGTFAKYVTSASGNDSARVAEFGVRITANGETFKDTYKGIETGWESKNTVDGEGEDVVAPGTSGDMVSMILSGTPEVAVRVSYEVTTFDLNGWTLYDGTTEYCPIVFTINETTYGTNDTNATVKRSSITALRDTIFAVIEGYSREYDPNTDLNDVAIQEHSLKISWSWAFEGNNVKDTILGDKAAGIAEDGSSMAKAPATISIAIKTTVTQID